MTSGSIPTLETERLRLRPWRDEDIGPFAEFCASEGTARFVGGVCGPDDAWRRMALFLGHWTLRGYGNWALEEKSSARFIGYCGLWNPHGWLEPEIMWALMAEAQGCGFATEAARRARGYAYRELGWRTAISCIATDNLPSQRVAARLGASLEKSAEVRGYAVGIYRHPAPNEFQA
jgi:RimJ/RimL family protein N-acetyltransferase